LAASTTKGIFQIAFVENKIQAFFILQNHFPNAKFIQYLDFIQQSALFIFSHKWQKSIK